MKIEIEIDTDTGDGLEQVLKIIYDTVCKGIQPICGRCPTSASDILGPPYTYSVHVTGGKFFDVLKLRQRYPIGKVP